MIESTVTLDQVFRYFPAEVQNVSDEKWKIFREKLNKEIKDIKWVDSILDLTKKIGDLFDINISDILVNAWKKVEAINKAFDESKLSPEKKIYFELAEHTIKSEHHPYIEIKVAGIPNPQKMNFTILLSFKLKGFILTIQNGCIIEIKTGSCEIEGSFNYMEITLAEKKLEPIYLPGLIHVQLSNK